MQFKGQLLLPGESGAGLSVNLDVAEHHLAVQSDSGGLGAWPLEVVDVERLHGAEFSLTVAGEPLRFVADDTVAFAYTGVPIIEAVTRKSGSRSGFRSMLDRIWNGPEGPDQAVPVDTMPDEEQTSPVPIAEEEPDPREVGELLVSDSRPTEVFYPIEEPPIEPAPHRVPATPAPDEAPGSMEMCPAFRNDGRRCESRILTSSGYCYPHDPRRAFEDDYQLALEARGQLKRESTARLNRIYDKLDKAIRQVERGDLDPESAMAMAQLARTMCAIVEMSEPPGAEDL